MTLVNVGRNDLLYIAERTIRQATERDVPARAMSAPRCDLRNEKTMAPSLDDAMQ